MRTVNTVFVASALLLSALLPDHVQADKPDIQEIERTLACTCGCTLTVEACLRSMTCSTSKTMKAEIADMVSKGMDREKILDAFVKKHGEQVLAAPTKRGFNLTAWIMPFLALVVGLLVIGVILNKWNRAPFQNSPAQQSPTSSKLTEDEEMLFAKERTKYDNR